MSRRIGQQTILGSSQQQQHAISPDKTREDNIHSDEEHEIDEDDTEINVDESDDVTSEITSAKELQDQVKIGKLISDLSNLYTKILTKTL